MMMLKYVDRMNACQSIEALAMLTAEMCADFGYAHAVYTSDFHLDLRTTEMVHFANGAAAISSACLRARLDGADPIADLSEGKSTPIFWTPAQADTIVSGPVLQALRDNGVLSAITVPLYGVGDEFGTLSVFGAGLPEGDIRHGGSLAAQLLFMASVVHENARRIRQGEMRQLREAADFTPRERDFIGYLLAGMSAKEIAARIHRSVASVNFHCGNIYKKLGVDNQRKAIVRLLSIGYDGRHAGNDGMRSV